MPKSKPLFITMEGIEGAGKSTHIGFVKTFLEETGVRLVSTREPGGTPIAENIRELLLNGDHSGMAADTELLLMFAARAEHLKKVIEPALASGHWVLCDRFTDATYAYQGSGRGIDSARIASLERWVQGELRPDLTLILDVNPAEGLRRAAKRSSKDRFEREEIAFFERVRAGYRAIAAGNPGRVKLIDSNGDPADTQAQLRSVLAPYLP